MAILAMYYWIAFIVKHETICRLKDNPQFHYYIVLYFSNILARYEFLLVFRNTSLNIQGAIFYSQGHKMSQNTRLF